MHRRWTGGPLLLDPDEEGRPAPRHLGLREEPVRRHLRLGRGVLRRDAGQPAQRGRARPHAEIEAGLQPLGRHRASTSRARTIRCGGHGFVGIGRKRLLDILQARCGAAGRASCAFETEVDDDADFADADLIVASRRHQLAHPQQVRRRTSSPTSSTRAATATSGSARTRLFDAFTFAFEKTEHGWFQAHAYQLRRRHHAPSSSRRREDVWRAARPGPRRPARSRIAFCEQPVRAAPATATG
ncbi:MAG: hypothetical protein MZW92_17535 [Comamonadaceae bacterium]|nr:hypothetical protein [Comamonadaceae bacterium]